MTQTHAQERTTRASQLLNHFKLQKFSRTAQERKKRLRSILYPVFNFSDGQATVANVHENNKLVNVAFNLFFNVPQKWKEEFGNSHATENLNLVEQTDNVKRLKMICLENK
jgi:hypothetical protein